MLYLNHIRCTKLKRTSTKLGNNSSRAEHIDQEKKITEIESITDICLTKLFSYLGLYTTLCHNIIKIVGHLPVYTKHNTQLYNM